MENIKDVTVRNIEDDLSYIKDRGSWTQTLSRKSGKMIERLLRLEQSRDVANGDMRNDSSPLELIIIYEFVIVN